MISLTSVVQPISRETSLYIKGGAIILMLLAHLIPEAHVEFYSINIFTGISCLAFYAFVSGYAHALIANKSRNRTNLQLAGKCYLNFYIYYIICCAIVIPIYLIGGKLTTSDIPLIIIPIKCFRPVDPWWYAFCYGVFCFVLFPLLRWFEKAINNEYFIVILFLIILATILLPISFRLPLFPNDFRQMWYSIPILRTIMIIPYYMMGFGYYKYIQPPVKKSLPLILIIISLLIFAFFPFSIYNISGIKAVDIGFSFIICSIVFRVIYANTKLKNILIFTGTHSTFLWLLHMPIRTVYMYIGYHYLPSSLQNCNALTFLIVFSLSLAASLLLTYIIRKIKALSHQSAEKHPLSSS